MALTNKQQAFIEEYLQCWNAAEAARRAGYSERSARNIGHENLTKPDIAQEIQRRVDEKAMSANEVLVRLADIARGDLEDFVQVKSDGKLFVLNLEEAKQAGKFHLIKKMKYNAQGLPEIELHDAFAALVKIGEVHGMFRQVSEVEHSGEIPIVILPEGAVDDLA